ncbi:proteasome assembly chaperone 2-like [Eriocheir sinensis]|uniref:proteasome assembly chaperone 2-like n=1 Tax=Eriocheir sinensis TaxID=95602 RepID=UPI0021C667F3|nr:proteasome assembly chaperone 2-like [Eriocheir sinensis]XP_050727998.1 proteasome assembly chaperone 2-like [Eriocheir sinensis]XP_050727999.1 proteasome assembly chaperone 2-like [Eriocheir sinensis]XP_050728001.1 proteasome assembly chaperone 2-like [Eriocheir sinensis]XP_050728002.1 proteasome assembly chaperone 2-like [Eriocheir sinensis]XP_050728003.1 proteasome assembly chaperone 2-like [Eriocheir sinensis]
MLVYPCGKDLPSLTNYTLILPSVSVGNAGQLAVDLIITNLACEKVGIVHHPALYPLVGGSPYDPSSKEVTTSADLHVLPAHSLAVMQIRVPLIKSERHNFLTELMGWCKSVGIREVVMLASCNAYERWDNNQITGPQLRYLTSHTTEEDVQGLVSVGALELEKRTDEEGVSQPFLSGAGFVKHFMEICDLPTTVLIKFVEEGDNTMDAVMLLNFLNAWKKLVQDKAATWKMPFSWKNMFGRPTPQEIY